MSKAVRQVHGSSVTRSIIAMLAIAWFYGYAQFKRNVFWSFHYVIAPLAFFFFIHLYGRGAGTAFALVGGFIMVTLSASISMETEAAFNRIVLKMQDIYVASPVRPIAYVLGLALANELSALPGIAIFLLLTYILYGISIGFILTLAAATASIWFTFSSIGFLISTFARDVKDLWTWTPIISAAISVLPPVFYPLELLPRYLDWIVYVIPPATASRLLQASLGAVSLTAYGALSLWAALIAQSLVASVILLRSIRWRIA